VAAELFLAHQVLQLSLATVRWFITLRMNAGFCWSYSTVSRAERWSCSRVQRLLDPLGKKRHETRLVNRRQLLDDRPLPHRLSSWRFLLLAYEHHPTNGYLKYSTNG
jgi:hypothetical protein